MQRVLVDAGPLIALFDKSDRWHHRVLEYLKTYNGRLISTWPVLTEVTHMLDFNRNAQIDFLTWVNEGGIEIYTVEQWQLNRIIILMSKYADLPPDLADITLVVASESLGVRKIMTIDSDFQVYRTEKGKYLENVLGLR